MEERGNNTGIFLAVGGLAAVLLYKGFVKPNIIVPKQLQTFVTKLRVQIKNPKVQGDQVSFDVDIQNPNSQPITVNAIVGDVFLDTKGKSFKLGNVAHYGANVIKPVGQSRYNFAIKLKLVQLIAYFNDILAGKIHGQTIRFTGSVNINGRAWPVTERIPIV